MTKPEFKARFYEALAECRRFACETHQVELPAATRVDFNIRHHAPQHKGKCKVWGGRLLDPNQLENVAPEVAWRYLWVDGRIPAWVNVIYVDHDENGGRLEIRTGGLVEATRDHFSTDDLEPFRIRCRVSPGRPGTPPTP